jgi:AcrR family transcriptional regulator
MDLNSSPVKPPRRYDSRRRQQQALRSRVAVLETAQQLFLTRGYAATTIAAIADTADVSVETIYKAFGGKPGLVRAIWEHGLAGVGPVPAEQRSDEMRALETDPRKIIQNWGILTSEVAPRVAPILLLIRTAAATDPEMAALREAVVEAHLVRMEVNARHLYDRGDLRGGLSLAQARDIMWLYSSPEVYELLVLRQRWPLQQFGRFIAESLVAALLPPGSG